MTVFFLVVVWIGWKSQPVMKLDMNTKLFALYAPKGCDGPLLIILKDVTINQFLKESISILVVNLENHKSNPDPP